MTARGGADANINRGASPMPGNEELRLECLRLAITNCTGSSETLVADARAFYDFITGIDRAALTERAKAAVDALR